LARVEYQERELRSGSLCVRVELDADGALRGVTLPEQVPADLTAAHLSDMLAQLGAWPRSAEGAPFWRKVWERMAEIPWGHALTYQELAEAVGSPRACRAVGQACARNPLPLIVPCHRVLGNEGLGGFAYGSGWKSALLALETEPRPS
jgi:O-6-methylguanine DNA methyltransferase